ncbi:unnamed protein product [Candidula unifasciata]|uniref:Uncharacterized protein n=1 Tax=Candidula unifasciata TaxID=100452 RepID=A0A8S3Z5A6_9EUPU|nr:unnamed protein product [Candidula unifasciata]
MFLVTAGAVLLVVAIIYIVLDTIIHFLKVGHITDKYVFITGCDSGFGHLAAKQLDKLGFHVFAGCLTKEGAKSVTESCSSRVTTVELDIRSTESIQQAVKLVESKLPPNTGVWALINNAGIVGLAAPAEMCSREDVQVALGVNLLGPIDVTRHFLPLIRKSHGRIVNTTSVSGRVAIMSIPYSVSKFGLEGFSNRLRREVWPQGIKVSIVEPGAFRTPIMNVEQILRDFQEAFDKHSPDIQAVYGGFELKITLLKCFESLKTIAATDLAPVVDAYIHAVTAQYPHRRYKPGRDAMWFYSPLCLLSDSAIDMVLWLLRFP